MTNMRNSLLKFLSLAAIVLAACDNAKERPYESVPDDPMQTRIYTLDNGLKVYLSVNKEKPRIQANIAVRTGSRNDPAETTGLAHYLEHIMFKGTTHFGTNDYETERPFLEEIERRYEHYRTVSDPDVRKQLYHEIDSVSQLAAYHNIPNEYDKMMAAIGSEASNAYTSNDVTCYIENIPANEVENWARVQADRFQNMVVRGFHTELESVYEEYNMGLAQDANKLYNALMAKLFPNHPYGTQTVIGRGEHLKNPSIKNIKEYFRRYYVPNNVAICMAGDLEPDAVMDIIEEHFGPWQRSDSLSRPTYAPLAAIAAPQDTSVTGPEAEELCMAWRFPEGRSLMSDTLEIIGQLLNNGKAGLLDLNVSQQMKAQDMFAFSETMADYTMFLLGGQPKRGQTLEEVRALALEELEKLKRGEFADELLPGIINNMKRDYYEQLLSNNFRAHMFSQAFVNGTPWAQAVGKAERQQGMTKEQIMDFAQRHLRDNFVCIYKRQGHPRPMPKVEKPGITPIMTNSHLQSDFLEEITENQAEPIEPVFPDFQRDITKLQSASGKEILYKQNTEEELFTLQLRFPLGSETNPLYDYAADYLDYLGTSRMTSQQLKQAFYGMACDYSFAQGSQYLTLTLQGLNEHLPKAAALVQQLLQDARPDEKAYDEYIGLVSKARTDAKANQQRNFRALSNYAIYGHYNPTRSAPSEKLLRETKPAELLAMLKNLCGHDFTTLYYGASSQEDIRRLVAQFEQGTTPARTPEAHRFSKGTTFRNEIYIAPYNAKNIYLMSYHNEGNTWNPRQAGIKQLFNDYFGGGMNAIVFQEMREVRGLAYSAGASYVTPWRTGDTEHFQTIIITQNDKMMDCLREFRNLLDSIPQREVGFNLAKQALIKKIAANRTTRFAVLSSYLDARELGLDEPKDKLIYEQLHDITLEDLGDFAHENIAGKTHRYVILGNEFELDMEALGEAGTIYRLSTEEIFGY